MAISYIDASSNFSTASGATVVVTAPTVADNDLMVAIAGASSSTLTDTWTLPSGFTTTNSHNETPGRNISAAIGYKIASSESGNYTFTLGTSTSVDRSAGIVVLRGIDTGTPLDVTYVHANHHGNGENDPTPPNSAITTVTDGAWVLVTSTVSHDALTGVAPTSYTLRIDESNLNANLHLASREITTATTESPGDWAHTGGNAAAEWDAYTIAIRPASASNTRRYTLPTLGVG